MNAVPPDQQPRSRKPGDLPPHPGTTAPSRSPLPAEAATDPGDGPAVDPRHEPRLEPDVPAGGRLEVSGTQVAASVLASVSAAVIASFFGVAGTIVGAAVVSVIATLGSAAYGLGIRRTRHRLQNLQALRTPRPFLLRRPDGDAGPADPTVEARPTAGLGTPAAGGSSGWRDRLAERRWGVAAGVALVFVISLMSVTLIELVGDRPLSGESSGSARTSLGAVLPSDDGSDADGDDTDGGDPNVPPATAPADATTTTRPESDGTPTTTTAGSRDGSGAPTAPTPTSTTTSVPPATTTTTTPDAPGTTTVPVPTTAAPPPAG